MFRAARLVVNTGLHHYRWSRENAIAYYNDSLGTPEGSNVTEIERYCVWPGQATSYMVGQTRWVAIREKAKATLGDKFDLRAFHDTALSAGAMPIEVLRSEEHTSELQSLMRISYAVFCLKKKTIEQ